MTGGAGFIGSNLSLALQEKGWDVVVIDNFLTGDFHNLIQFHGDVIAEDVNAVNWDALGSADAVFHQAAITDTTLSDQKQMIAANVEGMRKALQFAAKLKIPFVYASSAAQYGNEPAPQREDGPIKPLNVYAFSKMLCDQLAESAAKQYRIPVTGLRYFNVYGLREQYKGKASSMIYQLAQQMRSGKRPRIFFDGEQMRDHIYVKDVVAANLNAFEAKKSGIVNIGTGKATSFNRLIEVLNDVLGASLEPDYFENPYGFYQNKTQADTARAKKLIGFEARYTIEKGVRDYLTALYHIQPGQPSSHRTSAKTRV